MREYGIVINKDSQGIMVKMQNDFACGGCHLCQLDQERGHILYLRQEFPAVPGDKVEIEIKPSFAITSAFLLFFLPLCMLIIGYFLFQNYLTFPAISPDYRGIIGAILAFVSSYVVIYFYDRHLRKNPTRNNVKISRIMK